MTDRLRVPNPRGYGGCLWMAAYVTSVLALVGLEFAILGWNGDPPWIVHGLALAAAAFAGWMLLALLHRRSFTLRNQGGRVVGSGRDIPVGDGTISVREELVRRRGYCYAVELDRPPDPPRRLEPPLEDPVQVRAYVEGLCRVGRHRMRWKTLGVAGEEIREPEDLDRPLVQRLAPGQTPFGTDRAPKDPQFLWERDPDGTLRYRWKAMTVAETILALVLFTPIVAAAFGGYAWFSGSARLALAVGAAGGAACVLILGTLFMISQGVQDELRISPRGLERVRTLLWFFPSTLHLRPEQIESVYVDQRQGPPALVLVTDAQFLRVGHFSNVQSARQASDLLIRALRGEPTPP